MIHLIQYILGWQRCVEYDFVNRRCRRWEEGE